VSRRAARSPRRLSSHDSSKWPKRAGTPSLLSATRLSGPLCSAFAPRKLLQCHLVLAGVAIAALEANRLAEDRHLAHPARRRSSSICTNRSGKPSHCFRLSSQPWMIPTGCGSKNFDLPPGKAVRVLNPDYEKIGLRCPCPPRRTIGHEPREAGAFQPTESSTPSRIRPHRDEAERVSGPVVSRPSRRHSPVSARPNFTVRLAPTGRRAARRPQPLRCIR
jgi:hypothetical protein